MLKRIVTILILSMWPISLFLANTKIDFINYVLPIFQPKLILIPLLYFLFNFNRKNIKYIILSLLLVLIFFKPFYGQTIFIKDYEHEQQNLQKSNLYNSIPLARIFQNKMHIPMDKVTNNFFALIDPNNYFFGFAPRQITIDNQNLKKFPFLSLPFMLIGLYYIFKNPKNHKTLLTFLAASIINLSILTNFDRNDFILWIPISLIIIYGLNIFDKRFKYKKLFYGIFILFSVIEILRIFL
jgi:hypothetical protein